MLLPDSDQFEVGEELVFYHGYAPSAILRVVNPTFRPGSFPGSYVEVEVVDGRIRDHNTLDFVMAGGRTLAPVNLCRRRAETGW